MGVDYDGAWAEFVVAPKTTLVAVPEGVPDPSSRRRSWPTPSVRRTPPSPTPPCSAPGESVGVWGAGGLGVHAIQLARAKGASPIIAVDTLDEGMHACAEFGADAALDPRAPDFAQRIGELTQNRGLDVALDFVGAPPTVIQAEASLTRFGRLVIVGSTTAPLEFPSSHHLVRRQHVIRGHLGYFSRHLRALVALVDFPAPGPQPLDQRVAGSRRGRRGSAPAGSERSATRSGS